MRGVKLCVRTSSTGYSGQAAMFTVRYRRRRVRRATCPRNFNASLPIGARGHPRSDSVFTQWKFCSVVAKSRSSSRSTASSNICPSVFLPNNPSSRGHEVCLLCVLLSIAKLTKAPIQLTYVPSSSIASSTHTISLPRRRICCPPFASFLGLQYIHLTGTSHHHS